MVNKIEWLDKLIELKEQEKGLQEYNTSISAILDCDFDMIYIGKGLKILADELGKTVKIDTAKSQYGTKVYFMYKNYKICSIVDDRGLNDVLNR